MKNSIGNNPYRPISIVGLFTQVIRRKSHLWRRKLGRTGKIVTGLSYTRVGNTYHCRAHRRRLYSFGDQKPIIARFGRRVKRNPGEQSPRNGFITYFRSPRRERNETKNREPPSKKKQQKIKK